MILGAKTTHKTVVFALF